MINLKKVLIASLSILLVTGYSSCAVKVSTNENPEKIPPGQIKKITGSKSAEEYAPGHNK